MENFGKTDFAASFGANVTDFSPALIDLIESYDFQYRSPSKEELDGLILEVLKKIDQDTQIIGAMERTEVWQKGWKENLDSFREGGFSEASLVPKFVRPGNPVRLNQQYVFPSTDKFELNFIDVYRHWFLEKYLSDVENIYEFGCGTGFNLLAASKIFPTKQLWGSDFVQSSVDLVNEIASSKGLNLSGDIFNMLSPSPDYEVKENSGVFTFGSLEQLASDLDPMLNYLLSQKPKICVHTEPAVELYDSENNLYDHLAAKFQSKRGYSSGLIPRLKRLESEGKIQILAIKRLYFGSFFLEGYNHIAWRVD